MLVTSAWAPLSFPFVPGSLIMPVIRGHVTLRVRISTRRQEQFDRVSYYQREWRTNFFTTSSSPSISVPMLQRSSIISPSPSPQYSRGRFPSWVCKTGPSWLSQSAAGGFGLPARRAKVERKVKPPRGNLSARFIAAWLLLAVMS